MQTDINVIALERDLKTVLEGEVHFDNGYKALYATDASNYRQVPVGVVLPKSKQDIIETISACRKHHAPLLSRGGGTSLAGQCCNVAVVMDMSKYYNNILQVKADTKHAFVQSGTVLDDLVKECDKYKLTFAPDPATHNHCTLGGMIGNNSCGIHSVMGEIETGGTRTSDFVEELEIMTYDGQRMVVGKTSEESLSRIIRKGGRKGEIYKKLKDLRDKYEDLIREKFPKIPRRVSGFNLDELLPENGFNVARALVGTEGTCVTFLEAKLKLVKNPQHRTLLILGYPDVYEAANHVTDIMRFQPVGLEGIDQELIGYMKKKNLHPKYLNLFPEGKGWLVAEFGGDSKEEAASIGEKVMQQLREKKDAPEMELYSDPEDQERIWTVRESGLGATAFVPEMEDTWPGWEDSAVPPEKVAPYLQELRELFNKYNYQAALYGHFGQGCIHCRIDFGLSTSEQIEKYKAFTNDAADLVLKYGGSLSGEHGDGQARGDLLEKMYGPELVQAFQEFKSIWDPEGKMNPGKVVEPYSRDQNLRLGSDYNPAQPETYFQYPDDEGSFARATLRCVGVGKCRRSEGGTMCPSYMVTREEKHTTRGRAHLLFEMMNNDVIKDKWRDENIKEALDLCLSCKGCKGDCPVNVDVATYKAEFLAHYYKNRIRPRHAYAFGLINVWAKMAAKMPRLVNFFTHTPGLKNIAKWAAGMSQKRTIPRFAKHPFTSWYKKSRYTISKREKVILWPDTFNNYFYPGVLKSGVEVLEKAGYDATVPPVSLCCGRPLYDYGMLKKAKKYLRNVLDALRDDIRSGVPVVGMEPSCIAVFRDELINLFPHDNDARRLSRQCFTLGEFLNRQSDNLNLPRVRKNAILHRHCHHEAIMGTDNEVSILKKMGLKLKVLDSGCCGMAGSFGFESGENYEVSIKAGERMLLPEIRETDDETLIITDGFSCREQIKQQTGRDVMHLAEVILKAWQHQNGDRVKKKKKRSRAGVTAG